MRYDMIGACFLPVAHHNLIALTHQGFFFFAVTKNDAMRAVRVNHNRKVVFLLSTQTLNLLHVSSSQRPQFPHPLVA